MNDDDMPFRCSRCGTFVGSQRLQEADDYGPKPCKQCERAAVLRDTEGKAQ